MRLSSTIKNLYRDPDITDEKNDQYVYQVKVMV